MLPKNSLIDLSSFLNIIGLDDEVMNYKIMKLQSMDENNIYLEKDLMRIAEIYNLEPHKDIPKIRKFVKKI